jgi:hypothetical protein
MLPQPGFDPRTVYPIAIRYTDYAIPARSEFPGHSGKDALVADISFSEKKNKFQ